MLRLKKRAEFLAVSRGTRAGRRAFSLQSGTSDTTAPDGARVGFTVTKKVGTATERNRIRRRLREAVRALPDGAFATGHDYVLVGRREALGEPFRTLVADLRSALGQLRRQSDRNAGRRAGQGNPSDGGAGSDSQTLPAQAPNPSGDP